MAPLADALQQQGVHLDGGLSAEHLQEQERACLAAVLLQHPLQTGEGAVEYPHLVTIFQGNRVQSNQTRLSAHSAPQPGDDRFGDRDQLKPGANQTHYPASRANGCQGLGLWEDVQKQVPGKQRFTTCFVLSAAVLIGVLGHGQEALERLPLKVEQRDAFLPRFGVHGKPTGS